MTNSNLESAVIKVKIVRSLRRHKTVSARMSKDTMYVYAPERIAEESLQRFITLLRDKFIRQRLRKELNQKQGLFAIASELNRKYFAGKLKIDSIEYVTNQSSKFGCCDYRTRAIRISHEVAGMPDWVRDYVLVHELAHLVEPNHSKAFWEIVYRYKLSERARGYLIAKGLELNDLVVEESKEGFLFDETRQIE